MKRNIARIKNRNTNFEYVRICKILDEILKTL